MWDTKEMLISSLQGTVLNSLSNIFAQLIDYWRHDSTSFIFNWTEFLRFSVVMALLCPLVYYWQIWMESTWPGQPNLNKATYLPVPTDHELDNFNSEHEARETTKPHRLAGRSWKNILIKWSIDNSAGALWYTLLFIILIEIFKLKSPSGIWQALLHDTIPLLLPQYILWPAATLINFIWIPVSKRVVFLAWVGLVWGIYLSLFEAEPQATALTATAAVSNGTIA